MKFISENLVEQAAELLNASEESYERAVEEMEEEQPVLLSYFFTEDFQVFTQSEKEYLFYLMLVVWKAVSLGGESIPAITEQQLSQAEDSNWEQMQGVKARGFHERLNVFFDNYPQEDLLAFVEDALSDEEDDDAILVTKEGREALFVSLKSAIDCLAGLLRQAG
ncbi:MAG: hypothetical protein H6557_16815 [Lewinellaceae bacterium]|nr:hypothetical protein [Phaeodactylibacter sp.]MCB9038278.1 hypothetical protein [Lewinellaceae bacterium]